jgi:mono/diheme cytochrome c family protein
VDRTAGIDFMTASPLRRWLRLGAVAVLLLPGAGAASAAEPGRGGEIYRRVCSACHGEKGDGKSLASHALRSSPRDFTTQEARTSLTREYMIAIVRDGRPHTPMVGRAERLGQEEIEAAVDYIRATFMPPEPGPGPGR